MLDYATLKQVEILSHTLVVDGHMALLPEAHIARGATDVNVIPTHVNTINPAAPEGPTTAVSGGAGRGSNGSASLPSEGVAECMAVRFHDRSAFLPQAGGSL